ncbi:MAG: hypothetical protein U0166_20585 [Acidobacteriota bacterium]
MRRKIIIFSLTLTALALSIVALSVPTRADSGLASLESRLALIPENAAFVLAVDFESLRRSDLYDKYGKEKEDALEADHAPFRELIEETGLDPRKDVDTLILGTSPSVGKTPLAAAGVVTGRFDTERIGAALKKEGAKIVKASGHAIYLPIKPGESDVAGKDTARLRDHDPRTARGRLRHAGLRHAASRRQRSRRQGLPRWRRQSRADLGPRHPGTDRGDRALARFLGQGQSALGQDGLPPALRTLKSVETVTFSLNLSDAVDVAARATCGKPEDAMLVHDAIKGMLAMAKLASQEDNRDLAGAIDLAQIQNDGNAVTFSIKVPADVIEKWHDTIEKLHHGQDAPPVAQAI